MTLHRLVDFQLDVKSLELPDVTRPNKARGRTSGGLPLPGDVDANYHFFPLNEVVRLRLRQGRTLAPFRKLVVSFTSSESAAREPRIVLGVCLAERLTTPSDLTRSMGNLAWQYGEVLAAVADVERHCGQALGAVAEHFEALGRQEYPLRHELSHLARTDRRTGTRCSVRFVAEPYSSAVEVVRAGRDGAEQRIVVASRRGPLWLDDEFRMKASRVVGGVFRLVDPAGAILARVPLEEGDHGS